MADAPDGPRFIELPDFGRLEVLDASDPSLPKVKHSSGNVLSIGKAAAGWPVSPEALGTGRPRPSSDATQSGYTEDWEPEVGQESNDAEERRVAEPKPKPLTTARIG